MSVRSVQLRQRRPNLTPYLFLAVPLLIYLIWVIAPMFYSFYLSFTNWDGVSAPGFVGLKNYAKLFRDPIFYKSLTNNLKWLVCFITIPVAMGLALALLLNQDIAGDKIFKACFYSPMVLSFVVIGLIWSWMYHPANGLINSTLRTLGLGSLAQGWLSDKDLALYAIIAAAVWRQVGYVMILYLAGLNNIDPSFLEAAEVDGASRWQSFWRIILPLLTPVTVIVVVISIIDSLRAFDLVFVMTRGGPYNSSSVLANFMYIEAFNNYKMGYGAAIAVILFLISLSFIGIYLWRMLQTEIEY